MEVVSVQQTLTAMEGWKGGKSEKGVWQGLILCLLEWKNRVRIWNVRVQLS